jgi:hypothetical protein
VLGVLAAPQVYAHHSPAAYDLSSQVVVEGTVASVDWRDPHVHLVVESRGADGAQVKRDVEAAAKVVVEASGLTKSLLPVGSPVIVRGAPRRAGEGPIWGLDLTTADGTVYALSRQGRAEPLQSAADEPSIASAAGGLGGQWAPPLGAFVTFQRTAAAWSITDAAQEARKSFSFASLRGGCGPDLASPLLTAQPKLRTIEIEPAGVRIRFDGPPVAERFVHLDQAEHPRSVEPTLQGHSIGRWEGATLVIDTVGFAPHHSGVTVAVPSGPRKHLVERLTRTDDGLHLRYGFTLEDPDNLPAPVSHEFLWDYHPDLEPSTERCEAASAETGPR